MFSETSYLLMEVVIVVTSIYKSKKINISSNYVKYIWFMIMMFQIWMNPKK